MPIKRVIAVTYVAGRVGSSLTMGLLEKAGFDVGDVSRRKDSNNPEGYWEITEYLKYLRNVFPNLDKFAPKIPDYNYRQVCDKHQVEFNQLLSKWFNGHEIAIKVPYCFPLSLFSDYDVTVIHLKRHSETQAASIAKMNTKQTDWADWLSRWNSFAKQFNGAAIHYEKWQTDPYQNWQDIAKATSPPKTLSLKEVNEFINPKYIHNGSNTI